MLYIQVAIAVLVLYTKLLPSSIAGTKTLLELLAQVVSVIALLSFW